MGNVDCTPVLRVHTCTYLNHDTTYPYWPPKDYFNGVIYLRSEVRPRDVTDGLSNTYMICEKYLNPDHYFDGGSVGDDEPIWTGFNGDTSRSANPMWAPFRDTPGLGLWSSMGSAHPNGFHVMFADGSVRMMPFDIDPAIHSALGSRDGEEAVDLSDLR
jgi:prepilin-type processing-associated H-X9-DG protein